MFFDNAQTVAGSAGNFDDLLMGTGYRTHCLFQLTGPLACRANNYFHSTNFISFMFLV